MNEVVRDAVDVPRNAHRINEAKNEHDPERDSREQIEHPEKNRRSGKSRPTQESHPNVCAQKSSNRLQAIR